MSNAMLIIPILLLAAAVSILIFPIAYEFIPLISDYVVEEIMRFLKMCKKYIESRVRYGK